MLIYYNFIYELNFGFIDNIYKDQMYIILFPVILHRGSRPAAAKRSATRFFWRLMWVRYPMCELGSMGAKQDLLLQANFNDRGGSEKEPSTI